MKETASVAAWIRRISPAGWMALGACALALALTLQTLQGPGNDYDEGVYWQSLRAMANGHPLFGSVFSSQPPLFLLSIYPFYMLFGQSLSAARLGLLAFSLAGLAGTYVAGRALGHRMIGGVACLLLALDPLYEHSAHTLQAELPSIALQIWAVACAALAMRAMGRRRTWLAIGAGVLLGCALMVKLFAIVALVPIIALLVAPLAKRWRSDDGALRQPQGMDIAAGAREIAPVLGWLAAGLAGAIVAILLPFLGQLGAVYDQAIRFHLAASQADSHSLGTNLSILWQSLVATPPLYTSVVAIAVLIWRRVWGSLPIALWLLAALIMLARQQPLLAHHAVLLSPALALLTGWGVCAAREAFAAPGSQSIGVLVTRALLVVACAVGLVINWQNNAQANIPEPTRTLEMALALQSVTAPTEVVLSDDQYVAALANRDVPPQFVDTSAVRITSGYLTTAQLQAFVTRARIHAILFASGRFNLLPGFRAWVAARYTRIATFDHGGALYLLEPSNNPPV